MNDLMERWKSDLNHGIHHLSRHDPGGALLHFSRALSFCPVSSRKELSRILFFLGIALKKMGLDNSAIRSWILSLRVNKRSNTKKLLRRFSNDYGMVKQESDEMDDWKAFYSIQLMRYLKGFNKTSLTSGCERDCLRDIIWAYWKSLKKSGALEGRSTAEKIEIFHRTEIDFPLFYQGMVEDPVIKVNFETGKRLKSADRCYCGSGLPYGACCGRTPGEDELLIGIF